MAGDAGGDVHAGGGELSPQQWVQLGQAVQPYFRKTPVLSFM